MPYENLWLYSISLYWHYQRLPLNLSKAFLCEKKQAKTMEWTWLHITCCRRMGWLPGTWSFDEFELWRSSGCRYRLWAPYGRRSHKSVVLQHWLSEKSHKEVFLRRFRPRLHEDYVKTIGMISYLSGKKSFRIGLLFTRRRSVSANVWRRYEDDRKSGNFWRRYGNNMPPSSCKHPIRIDRSGSYQIVIAMHWPRSQASQSCIF